MDSRRDYQAENLEADERPVPTQAELEAMFDADDADVAAGRSLPAEPVLAEMRDTAVRIRRDRDAETGLAPRRA